MVTPCQLRTFPVTHCCSARARCIRWTGSAITLAAHGSGPSARTATAVWPTAGTRLESWSTLCRTRSLRARLIQESWVDWPDAVYDRVGNILLSRIMGAQVELVAAGFGIGFKESWENALEEVRASGGIPYPIPAGASDHRLGGLGFANWADEVHQQEQQLGVHFDTIIVCTVTGSTHAGMVAGFAGQERERRVIGIDGSAKPAETRDQVMRIARATAALIETRELRDDELI